MTQEQADQLKANVAKSANRGDKVFNPYADKGEVEKVPKSGKKRGKQAHPESELQRLCVKWYDLQYPQYKLLLWATPNGARRSAIQANIAKLEGMRSGIADLFLAKTTKSSHGLFIEMKYGKGKQSETQIAFQIAVESQGYTYKVIRDFDSFKTLVSDYIFESFA